jgi:hypothetical protein
LRDFDALWDSVPHLRGILRVIAVVWGTTFLVELGARGTMTVALPRERMELAGPSTFWVVLAGLLVCTVVYVHRDWSRVLAACDAARTSRSE